MEYSYNYIKIRRNFGRQPMFSEVASHLLDTVAPDKYQQNQYILRNPVNQECQACNPISEQYVNTLKVKHAVKGIEHSEGGWPKEINLNDEEATSRHCRRVERGDEYVQTILTTAPEIEHFIKQNNGINLYEHYFNRMPVTQACEKPCIQLNNIFGDPIKQLKKRPVACIDWTFEDEPKLVVAYCDKSYLLQESHLNTEYSCYIWNVEDHNEPFSEIVPPVACWQIACSPASPHMIVGGLADGRVCIFDIRDKKLPISFSEYHLAHRDPVTALRYLQSRTNCAFFSGSSDGLCLWYDIRNLLQPTDSLIISLNVPLGETPNFANAEPISVLHYDRAYPTLFYCGTSTGLVIVVNRRGKTYRDMMSGVYHAHTGAVKAIQPSPCTSKMFITCGDWAVNIWSKDIKSSPIITGTSQNYKIEDVTWAPYRYSCFISVGDDGKFRYWDVLRRLNDPLITMRLAKCPLLNIKCQADGQFIAIGNKEGSVHLLSLSENLMTPGEHEKEKMLHVYERETHREYILESRIKEIRVKAKVDQEIMTRPLETMDEEAAIKAAEENFRRLVLNEVSADFLTRK